MKKSKLYFKNEDAEMCYHLSVHLDEAKDEGLTEIELIEAIPDFSNPEYIWCSFADTIGDKSECNKNCPDYEVKNIRGCKHKGKLFEHGESFKFKIQMNKFEKWWHEIGSGIRPLENEDNEEHTKRVCSQFYNDVIIKNKPTPYLGLDNIEEL